MSIEELKQCGILPKYSITKANGEATDPNAEYFVLRLDFHEGCDMRHVHSCRAALINYAISIKDHLPELSRDIISKYASGLIPLDQMSPGHLRYAINEPGISKELAKQSIGKISTSLANLLFYIGSWGDFDTMSKLQGLGYDVWFIKNIVR